MLNNAEFVKGIKSSRLNTTPYTSRPSSIKDRAADRGLGLARRVNIPTNKREFNTDKPLVAPAPTNTAVSSKGSVPVNPKAVMKERNQAQIDSLQKKEYLKTYLKDKGSGTTSKPETITRAKYKVNSERKEVPVDRPVVNLDGTVTSRTARKAKREKPLTQKEKEEKARLAGRVGGVKRAASQETYEEQFPKRTIDDVISDNVRKKVETKQGVADAEKKAQYDKWGGKTSGGKGFNIPYITPALKNIGNTIRDKAINPAARFLVGRDMDDDEVRGTLAGLTFAPLAVGTLAYNDYQRKKDEEKKLADIDARRQAVLARRDAIIKERQNKLQQEMAKYYRKPDSIYANFLDSYEKAVAEFQDPATIQRLIQHGSTYIPQDNTGVVSLEKTLRGKMQKKKLREPKVPASMGVKEINSMIESGKPVGKYFSKTIRKSAEFNAGNLGASFGLLDGTTRVVSRGKNVVRSIHERTKNPDWDAVNAANIGRVAGATAGAIEGSGLDETDEQRANTGLITRAAKVVGLAGVGGSLGAHAGSAVDLGRERLRFGKEIRKAANFSTMIDSTSPDPKKSAKPKPKLPLTPAGVVASGAIIGGGLLAAHSLLKDKKKKKGEGENA